jgi:hypothetical protein
LETNQKSTDQRTDLPLHQFEVATFLERGDSHEKS